MTFPAFAARATPGTYHLRVIMNSITYDLDLVVADHYWLPSYAHTQSIWKVLVDALDAATPYTWTVTFAATFNEGVQATLIAADTHAFTFDYTNTATTDNGKLPLEWFGWDLDDYTSSAVSSTQVLTSDRHPQLSWFPKTYLNDYGETPVGYAAATSEPTVTGVTVTVNHEGPNVDSTRPHWRHVQIDGASGVVGGRLCKARLDDTWDSAGWADAAGIDTPVDNPYVALDSPGGWWRCAVSGRRFLLLRDEADSASVVGPYRAVHTGPGIPVDMASFWSLTGPVYTDPRSGGGRRSLDMAFLRDELTVSSGVDCNCADVAASEPTGEPFAVDDLDGLTLLLAAVDGSEADIVSPAIRVQMVSSVWTMTGAAGGGQYAAADLAAAEALVAALAAASVAVTDLLVIRAIDTGIEWVWLATAEIFWQFAPFGTAGGVVTAYAVLKTLIGGNTPTADGWTDASIATASFGTSGGTTTLSDDNTAGLAWIKNSTSSPGASDVVIGTYRKAVKLITTHGSGTPCQMVTSAYDNGTNYTRAAITALAGGTYWQVEHAATGSPTTAAVTITTTPFGTDTDQRVTVDGVGHRATYVFGDGDSDRPYTYDKSGGGQGHHADRARQQAAPGSTETMLCGVSGVAGTATLDLDGVIVLRLTLSGS